MNLNQKIADCFSEIADLLELQDASVFRIRAYRRATAIVQNLPKDASKYSEAELKSIAGIGQDLSDKILEYAKTGRIKYLTEQRKKFSPGLLKILKIPSVGPKSAKLFHDKLKIKNIAELKKAARSGRLLELPGIKEKTMQNILEGIELLRKGGGKRQPIVLVEPIAKKIISQLKKIPGLKKIDIAGSLRRKKPTIGDIDILVVASHPKRVMESFTKMLDVEKILGKGETKSSILLDSGIQVDLRVVPAESWGAALMYFTGNKSHNIRLRKVAISKSWKLNEYGIFRKSDNRKLAGKTEQEMYRKLGLKYLRPEEREES